MALKGIGESYAAELLRLEQQQGKTSEFSSSKYLNEEPVKFNSGEYSEPNLDEIEDGYLEAASAYAASNEVSDTEEAAASTETDEIDSTETEDTADTTDTSSSTSSTKSSSSTSSTSGVQSSSSSTGSTSVGSSEEIQQEIDELEDKKAENIEKMEKIEENIEKLAESAEKHIMEAAAEQEAAVSENEEETQKALDENLQAYIDANKEGGEGMTREELQQNIKNSLPNTPEIADAVAALTDANEEVNEIDDNLKELNKLIGETQTIEEELESKQEEYDEAVAAEEKESCCDPIGFTYGDGENQAQYDFIIDDGSFDSTSDFLGSDGNWSDMSALDSDDDKIITISELQAGNIKAVKTNSDGTQEIVDLAEEFGEDFSIDLNSYTEGGSYDGIDTTADSDGDGTADQSLTGTFSLNIDGETVSGYNTLDDTDWLNDNYGLSSDSSTDSETDSSTSSINYSEDLQPHVNFYNLYTEKSADLRSQIEDGYEDIGISKEYMDALNETTANEADTNAQNFFESLETENEDTDTTTDADTTTNAATSIDEDEEKEEELLEYAA